MHILGALVEQFSMRVVLQKKICTLHHQLLVHLLYQACRLDIKQHHTLYTSSTRLADWTPSNITSRAPALPGLSTGHQATSHLVHQLYQACSWIPSNITLCIPTLSRWSNDPQTSHLAQQLLVSLTLYIYQSQACNTNSNIIVILSSIAI